MKKRRFPLFLMALFSFGLIIPLTSCGPTHEAKAEWAHDSDNHWHECVVEDCDEHFDVAPHTYGPWKITTEPTCETKGVKERSCSVCGYKLIEEIPALGHEKETTWSKDETNHWHNCKNCDEKLDLAAHTYGEYTIDKEPTCTEKGSKSKVCSVCGYKITEEIPALGHDIATEWSHNETQHWKDCSRCDEKHSLADHTYGEFTVTKEATCTEKGSKYRTCSVCGYKQTVEIPALGHDFASEWSKDATHHWHDCSRCDAKKDLATHTYGDWIIVTDPTCETDGLRKKVCSVCGYEYKETLQALGHDIASEWSHDENQHWHDCSRCDEKHDLADHTFGEWVIDSEGTCNYPGEKHRICSVCGYKEVVQEITAPHLYSSLAITKNPTTTETGTLTITCAYGHTETVTLPKVNETDYQYYVTQIDAETANVEYSIKESAVTALLKGTMAENVEAASTALIAIKFGKHVENIACTHASKLSFNFTKHPTYEETGHVTYYCGHCKTYFKFDVPKLNVNDYNIIKVEDNNGQPKITYQMVGKAISEIVTKIQKTLPNIDKPALMKTLKNTSTADRWFTLNIHPGKPITDPTIWVKLAIDCENCPQSVYGTSITIKDTDKYDVVFEDGPDCSEPVLKYGRIKASVAEKFNLDDIKQHPDYINQITSLNVFKLPPTDEEIQQHIKLANKHNIGQARVKTFPTEDATGALEITCTNGCNYVFEYPIAKLGKVSYTKEFNGGRNKYTPTDEYLAVIAKEVVKKFNASINEVKDLLRPTLTFNKLVTPEVSLAYIATSPSGSFAVRVTYNNGENQDEMAGSTFHYSNKPEYYRVSFITNSCNELKKRLYLNEAGITEFLKVIKNYNDPFVKTFLENNYVGEYDASDEEVKNKKVIHHDFVIDEIHNSVDMGNLQDKYITWHCRKCNTTYRIDYSFNDIFVENDIGDMVPDMDKIMALIANKYKMLTSNELESLSNLIFARVTEI